MNLVAIGNYFGAHRPFADLFDNVKVVDIDSNVTFSPDDVVIFGGGADISPTIYNHKVSRFTGANAALSWRDVHEVRQFQQAVKDGAGIIGICRGAQLACAMSGGSLFQHVDNHAGSDHGMKTKDGDYIVVCSVHHQMMNPFNIEHELIGYSSKVLSNRHIVQDEEDVSVDVEPEIVFFPQTKALAIQYHPEFMNKGDKAVQYARQLVKEKFNV